MAFLKRPWRGPQPPRPAARRLAEIDDFVADQVDADGPGLAVAVVAAGTTIHAAGYGMADVAEGVPATVDTIFHLASCGKQFTGLGLLMLAENRKLQIDDPVGQHIPALAAFGPEMTLRTLLHHTSGIRDLYDEDGVAEVLKRSANPTNADVVRTYADLGCPMAEDGLMPGDVFNYSNSGYDLLGTVIETVSRQSYRDFFARRVFDRLGMNDTFSVPDRRAGGAGCAIGYLLDDRDDLVEAGGSAFDNLVGSGSFYTTAADLSRYDQALRANSLIGEAGIQEAFAAGQTNDGRPTNYGFGWTLAHQDGISFADHEGEWTGFRSYICYCLDRPLSMFLLSNHPTANLIEIANVATDACRGSALRS